MKRIGVISDTHNVLPDSAFELFCGQWAAEQVAGAVRHAVGCEHGDDGLVSLTDMEVDGVGAQKVDFILHAGDVCRQGVLDELEAIAPVVAVLGNNDFDPLFCSDGSVQPFRSLTYEGVRIAMAHIPQDLARALQGRPPLVPKLVKNEPQLAVCGHTHVPDVRVVGNHVQLNPGSPSRGRSGSGHNVALVDVEAGRLASVAIVAI